MKTSKQLREQSDELLARVEAISEVAQEEKRDLTAEEKLEVDGIMGVGKKGAEGYKAGKIDALEAELERAEKIESRMRARADKAAPDAPPAGGQTPAIDAGNRISRITIPVASRFKYGSLRSFTGEKADERAYLAGMFFLATICHQEKARLWCRDHGLDTSYRRDIFESPQAAHSTTVDTAGGFLVPIEIEQAIVNLKEQYGVFRQDARRVPMGSDTKNVPVRTSGLTAYWAGDNASLTATDTAWSNAGLVAKKLYAMSKYSSEVAEDSIIDFGDMLTQEIAQAFAYAEDAAGFLGDGTSTYGGIVGIKTALEDGSECTAASGNTTFATLDLVDFEQMLGKLPNYPGINPKWYISKAGWAASMMRLMDAGGGNTNATLGIGLPTPLFLGYPVRFAQVMNSTLTAQTSTEGLCYFGDLQMGALLGDRRGISIMVSDQRYFEYDQLAIRGTERLDITICSRGSSTVPGAIIGLETPGS